MDARHFCCVARYGVGTHTVFDFHQRNWYNKLTSSKRWFTNDKKMHVYFKLECIDEHGISSIAVSSGAAYLINPSWSPSAQLGVLCDSELTRHGLAPFWPTLGPRLWHTKQFVFLREDHEKKA